jgi:hypothetical protein
MEKNQSIKQRNNFPSNDSHQYQSRANKKDEKTIAVATSHLCFHSTSL